MPRKATQKPDSGKREPVTVDCAPDTMSGAGEPASPFAGTVPTRERIIAGATLVLLGVAEDLGAPAAARAQAARSLLELVGAMGPKAVPVADTKPVSEMTLAEIDALIAASPAD